MLIPSLIIYIDMILTTMLVHKKQSILRKEIFKMFKFEGRTAVISGGAEGIGLLYC